VPETFVDLLTRDHERLDRLLAAALRSDGTVNEPAYRELRRGLLRHIGIEERILFPEIRRVGGSTEVELQLHRDHAVLAALLVPPPSRAEIEQIRAILAMHNPLEEGAGGFYERMEELAGHEVEELTARVREYPEVRTAPYTDTPILRRSIETLMRQAEDGRAKLARG
jgi:hypothetical protein